MLDLGYNYRITDFQCALGLSQLKKLPQFLQRRYEIAAKYDEAFMDVPGIKPLGLRSDVLPAKQYATLNAPSPMPGSSHAMRHAPNDVRSTHAYHLYVIKVDFNLLGIDRDVIFTSLRERGIGVNVHYIPVHRHPFYGNRFGLSSGLCPIAESAYECIISLPIFSGMSDVDIEMVIKGVKESVANKNKSLNYR